MERECSSETFQHLVYHVFLPPKLPQEACAGDLERDVDLKLAEFVVETIHLYQQNEPKEREQWDRTYRMMAKIAHQLETPLEPEQLYEDLAELRVDDVLALHIRAQNAAVLVRKKSTVTIFEVFEVQPPNSDVMSTPGKLVRAYPGPAVELANKTIDEPGCLDQIAIFLAKMSREVLEGSTATTKKAGSQVAEVRDSAHPRYISELFLGFLRGIGSAAHPHRVVKRIADEVLWNQAYKPWRRSPLWLIIRVALQTTLNSTADYKSFLVFFVACLLRRALDQETLSSDLLFAMRVKMSRRLYKIQDSVPEFVLHTAQAVAEQTQEILQSRWSKIQSSQTKAPFQMPSAATFESATHQSLSNSRIYLEEILQGRPDVSESLVVSPNHPTRLRTRDFASFSRGALTSAFSVDHHVALYDFEDAVHTHLQAWTKRNIRHEAACAVIASCMNQYTAAALSYYTQDISDQSIMILTIMELWVSLDQLATERCPLLLDYSPEIPETIVESLLLRTAPHIERAGDVQRHLRGRHATAQTTGNPSIFQDKPTQYSLAVQYFRQSPEQKKLKEEIEHDAERKQKQKLDEMHKQNNEYDRLVRRGTRLEHNIKSRKNELFHDKDHCEKCRLDKETSNMRIEVYEWPLPSNQLRAESVVFELMCPEAFAIWRDETYSILCDLGSSNHDEKITPHYILSGQGGLGHWKIGSGRSAYRITVASSTKSFIQSHYSTTAVPAKESNVCVNNGLSFRLFDTNKRRWAAGPFLAADFAKYGTFKLPISSSYHYLRYALEGTGFNPNQAISDQSSCPKDLSLHEHLAFGTLRSGPRLQWMNIARELEESSFTFNRDEVNLLFTQAAWQLGPLTETPMVRDWHIELASPAYGKILVAQSTGLLDRVKENWREATSLGTVVMLVARLLASTYDKYVHQAAYQFLRMARSVALQWLDQLSKKLQHAETGPDVLDYQYRVCEVAAICRSTFDVDPEHLGNVLSSPEDFCNLVVCSVAVHDNQPARLSQARLALQNLICRDRRLAHYLVPVVLRQLRQNPRLLDGAIRQLWPSHRAGLAKWVELPDSNSRWISTTTVGVKGRNPQAVHINLLEGQLLIDGKPLGRLPLEYVRHSSYTRLFGQKVLDVVPPSVSGMEFTTRFTVEGQQISFALDRNNNNLVIQATKGGVTLELIPHSAIANDFPVFLSTDYHHWANLRTRVVEFRPRSRPWSSDGSNWRLQLSKGKASTMKLKKNNDTLLLVDMHSHLFKSIAERLAPLESSSYLHVMCSTDQRISIELPRMKLSFFINTNAELESDNLRNQVVDENQFSGTLVGLRNQLVLRAKHSNAQSLSRRIVLIPHGIVRFSALGDHVLVEIEANANRQVLFHQYEIDADLQYLTTTTGLTGRLFKIYLHALTSHCLPDPLTGRTGTEEALHELSESATSSFDQIDMDQAQLLSLIGSLTPSREFYPSHLQSMQSTRWANLPSLSQHYAYCPATESILRRADTLRLFHPLEFEPTGFMTARDTILLERSANRTRTYYPADTAARFLRVDGGLEQGNCKYASRDSLSTGRAHDGDAATWASSLAYRRWKQPTYATCDLVSMFSSWTHVQGPSDDLSLVYSSKWLDLKLRSSWLSIYNICRQATAIGTRYGLAICLSSAAYSGKLSEDLLQVLIAFSTNPDFRRLKPPSHSSYRLNDSYRPESNLVEQMVLSTARELGASPAGKLSRNKDETVDDFKQRQRSYHDQQVSDLALQMAKSLVGQWPRTRPQVTGMYSPWFEMKGCLETIHQYFISCSKNIELRTYLQQVEKALTSHPPLSGIRSAKVSDALVGWQANLRASHDHNPNISIQTLMESRAILEPMGTSSESDIPISVPKGSKSPADTSHLANLLSEFRNRAANPLHNQYGNDLEQSRTELAATGVVNVSGKLPDHAILIGNQQWRQKIKQDYYIQICNSLGPLKPVDHVVLIAGIWPRRTPRVLLQRLTLEMRAAVPTVWHAALTQYARLLLEYQRAQSLVTLAQHNRREEFFKEIALENESTDMALCDADWLLVQIHNNFRVRNVQSKVAAEMISPSSGANSVLQLNMGEGKSSVIVPIVAAALANGRRLVRVVVLKPLWRQMFQLLVSRLAGLAGRRIYYLPFGRHIQIGRAQAEQIQKIYSECMREGGILLAQPEHILSFKLIGIDRSISAVTQQDSAVSQTLRGMQDWLTIHSRDILDESDEILHVRYQLVYTLGKQQPLEDHPDRWTTTQQMLPLVYRQISSLRSSFPDSFKYEPRTGGRFPFIRIMPNSDEAVEQLVLGVAEDALGGHIPNLNLVRLSASVRAMAFHFLTKKAFSEHDYQRLKDGCGKLLWKGLLLLRGLLSSGILVYALKDKHYRVDYGLDNTRSLLAIPYHAKDIPSLRAEFGHPDVTVVLTCLSYYYQGLTDSQLDTCFNLLYKLDNPTLEYTQWVRRNDATPKGLRHLSGVNIKDREQFKEAVVPTFSYNAAVVDFFLRSVVFPKAAKTFPHKLATSGWDLAETKGQVTTGFSGTNDNQYLLPTSIEQADPVKQSSTNALVLTYLLQPENKYECTQGMNGETLSAKGFLETLVTLKPEIQVLLDVGAQMLELHNEELIRHWLAMRPEVSAGVFFNDKDELVVLTQNSSPVPLVSSPFSQQLDKCIVYLDDGHTRGTDLSLPQGARAAVTLGPKVTKDRLLQGCMRMRKLGHGQEVVFCAPVEIDNQIRKAASLSPRESVNTLDIIRWAMLETCNDLQRHISHWAQQGVEYKRRSKALEKYASSRDVSMLEKGCMTPEFRPLEDMYGISSLETSELNAFTKNVYAHSDLRGRLQRLGIQELKDQSVDEEQEREVSHEVERERQVERPKKSLPAIPKLHPAVSAFIETGTVPERHSGFVLLFNPLRSYQKQSLSVWSPDLLATVDFSTTITDISRASLNEYMRPVNWIVTGGNGVLVALSPYEVNELLPLIRESSFVRLHVYAPRVTQLMKSFSNLKFYEVTGVSSPGYSYPPSTTQLQLNLWAGQLYLDSFEEYKLLCAFLGIYIGTDSAELGDIEVESDGFLSNEARLALAKSIPAYCICRFTSSPLGMLKDLVGYRRKGMDYMRTHLGQLLHARILTSDDF
ncbi:hypothetical protein BDV93DRAFT_610484 [Ceratobasidium sp. AG-I]|nr:hypothetical protein BDV93DRAFT_610484 [Ceratobasidium sp. AG-I]